MNLTGNHSRISVCLPLKQQRMQAHFGKADRFTSQCKRQKSSRSTRVHAATRQHDNTRRTSYQQRIMGSSALDVLFRIMITATARYAAHMQQVHVRQLKLKQLRLQATKLCADVKRCFKLAIEIAVNASDLHTADFTEAQVPPANDERC